MSTLESGTALWSMSITPSDHTSTRPSISVEPDAISGDM